MYIKINQIYINTDNIFSLCPYAIENKENYEYGIILNGIKHAIFVGNVQEDGSHKNNQSKLLQIIDYIIKTSSNVYEMKFDNK